MDNSVNRISFLGVPVDAIDGESMHKTVERYLQDAQGHQVVLLTTKKLLRARHDMELLRCLKRALINLYFSKNAARLSCKT